MSGDLATYQAALRDGHALSWQLQWEAASQRYRLAVDEFPEDSAAVAALAASCYRGGDLAEALRQYQRLIELNAADDAVLSRIVEIRRRDGNPASLADAYLDLAAYRLNAGQAEEAARAWLDLAAALPEDLSAQERLYQAVSKAGDPDLASHVAQAITRLRGERAGRGVDPWAETPGPSGPPGLTNGSNSSLVGHEALAVAEEQVKAGRPQDALLAYAQAATALLDAGAPDEAWKIADAAELLAQGYGGLRFRDLLPLTDPLRKVVVGALDASQQSISAGHSVAAIDALLGGICTVPSCLPLQERLAEAQCARGAIEQALATLTTVAKLYLLRGQATRAIDALAKLRDLGSVPMELWHEGVSRLPDAAAQSTASREVMALARHLLDSARGAEAVSVLQSLAARVPDPNVAVSLGEALEATGDVAQAVAVYVEALTRDPANTALALRLVVAAGRAGDFGKAVPGLEMVLDAIADGAESLAAIDKLSAALRGGDRSLELSVALGAVLSQTGDFARAAEHLDKAAAAPGLIGAVARLGLANCALETGGPEAAVKHLAVLQRLLKERDPAQPAGWRWVARESQRVLAEMSQRKGDLDKAAAAFENVRRLSPDDSRACAKLAEVHFRRGDQSQAVAALEMLGDLHTRQGRPEQALLVYRGALQVAQANAALARKMADVCLGLGRPDEALGVLGQVAAVAESNGQAEEAVLLLREMIARNRQSDPALALSLRERIAGLLPGDPEAGQDLIVAYLAAGKSNEALAESLRLWRAMLAIDRFPEARSALQQGLKVDPWNPEALLGLGDLCERCQDLDGALQAYRRIVALDPENGAANARLEVLERRDGD